jgi:hypothetical protein
LIFGQQKEIEFLCVLLEFAQVFLLVSASSDEEQEAKVNEILKQLSPFPKHVSPSLTSLGLII